MISCVHIPGSEKPCWFCLKKNMDRFQRIVSLCSSETLAFLTPWLRMWLTVRCLLLSSPVLHDFLLGDNERLLWWGVLTDVKARWEACVCWWCCCSPCCSQEAERCGIHRTVHAGEVGPASVVKEVSFPPSLRHVGNMLENCIRH